MKRKINRVGKDTLTVSLPKKWAERFNLKKGEELEVSEHGRRLAISPESRKRAEINLKEYEPTLIENLLTVFYETEYKEIRINFRNERQFSIIKEMIGRLLGFEIVEQGRNKCTIGYTGDALAGTPHDLAKKMAASIKETASLIIEDLEKGHAENLARVKELDSSVQQTGSLALRKANQSCANGYLFTLLMRLELISRSYHFMHRRIKERKPKPSKETISLLKDINLFFEKVFPKTNQKMGRISSLKRQSTMLYNRIYSISESPGADSDILVHMGEILKLTSASVALLIAVKNTGAS